MGIFLSVVFGGLVSAAIAILIEYVRRPSVDLEINPPHDQSYAPGTQPATFIRSLRIKFVNRRLPFWARWTLRSPALQCRAAITFHSADGEHNIFGKAMEGRWSDSPEPAVIFRPSSPPTPTARTVGTPGITSTLTRSSGIAMTSRSEEHDDISIVQTGLFHRAGFLVPQEPRAAVYPGESALLDVAVRVDEDESCYGWNDESVSVQPALAESELGATSRHLSGESRRHVVRPRMRALVQTYQLSTGSHSFSPRSAMTPSQRASSDETRLSAPFSGRLLAPFSIRKAHALAKHFYPRRGSVAHTVLQARRFAGRQKA